MRNELASTFTDMTRLVNMVETRKLRNFLKTFFKAKCPLKLRMGAYVIDFYAFSKMMIWNDYGILLYHIYLCLKLHVVHNCYSVHGLTRIFNNHNNIIKYCSANE